MNFYFRNEITRDIFSLLNSLLQISTERLIFFQDAFKVVA